MASLEKEDLGYFRRRNGFPVGLLDNQRKRLRSLTLSAAPRCFGCWGSGDADGAYKKTNDGDFHDTVSRYRTTGYKAHLRHPKVEDSVPVSGTAVTD